MRTKRSCDQPNLQKPLWCDTIYSVSFSFDLKSIDDANVVSSGGGVSDRGHLLTCILLQP